MEEYDKRTIDSILNICKTSEFPYRTITNRGRFAPSCNIKSCKYLPYNEVKNLQWRKPFQSFINNGRCPNSLSRIIENILYSTGTHSYKLYQKSNPYDVNTFYGINFLNVSKLKYFNNNTIVTPQFLFVIESSRVIENFKEGSRRFKLNSDPITGQNTLEGFYLLIANEFVNSEDSKSLYTRLNKEFIPYLAKNGVNIIYTSEDNIMENAYKSDSLVFKSPFERQKFLDEMAEEVIEQESQEIEEIDLPF